jgi:hypothetical protein
VSRHPVNPWSTRVMVTGQGRPGGARDELAPG